MPNSTKDFLKSTLVRGFIFLVPVTLILVSLAKLVVWVREIIMPLAHKMPVANVAGTGIPLLMAIITILICLFIMGLLSKTAWAKKVVDWLESAILSNIPGYSFIKGMGESIVGVEDNKMQEVVLAWIEDSWQFSFVTERLENGLIAVYVPGAPSPWSGALYFMTEEKIKKIDITSKQALAIIKRMGIGSNQLMKDKYIAS